MAKARKRTKESSVQTEKAKADLCENEVTAADLTGGMYIYLHFSHYFLKYEHILTNACSPNRCSK